MMKAVRYVAMVLLIIGALDLGVSGMGYYDPIYAVFGDALAKILYLLIGLSGVYALVRFCQKCCGGCSCCSGSKCSCCHKGRK